MTNRKGGRSAEEQDFEQELLDAREALIGFCTALTRNKNDAADLVQEVMTKALENRTRYKLGTVMKAWLFVIARNEFFTAKRRAKTRIQNAIYFTPIVGVELSVVPEPEAALDLKMLEQCFARLRPEHQQAILLLSTTDMTYDEVALECQCPVGTVRSRAARGRARLELMMAAG